MGEIKEGVYPGEHPATPPSEDTPKGVKITIDTETAF
jgi:hypothetical protein